MVRTVKRQSGKTAILLGVGYTARAILPQLRAAGYKVVGTSRNPESALDLGIEMVPFDGNINPGLKAALSETHLILSSIPPHDGGDPFINAAAGDLMALAPNLEWAGYLSATSVYGDRAGQWVFEDEPLYPKTRRGRYRIEAELAWLESGAPAHIFRLAGIYGPEISGMSRNPFTRLTAGTARAVIKQGHIVNRIHVEDIAAAVMASIGRPDPMMVYNLSDGEPAPPQDVINFAADLLGVPRPPQIKHDDPALSQMARSFYGETKRVSNARAKAQLGWRPKYANYRQGLMAIYKAGRDNPNLVLLSGTLQVADDDISAIKTGLNSHTTLTRAEPGCLRFDVWQDKARSNVFHVFEAFESPEAFEAHQRRAGNSEWASISQNAIRHYDRVGL